MVKSKLGIKSVKKPVTAKELATAKKKVFTEQAKYRAMKKRQRAQRLGK